ncbi:MAG TPA: hypothetical protein VIQ02_16610 [Jiangellaceae bacterium]
MIDILHARGPHACGGVAFHYRFRPAQGTAIVASDAVLVDLTIPSAATLVICGSCGREDEMGAFVPDGGWG